MDDLMTLDALAENPLAWGGMLLRPTDERHRGFAGAPGCCGLYAMYCAEGALIYIGRSNSIAARLRTHSRRTLFLSALPVFYSWLPVPERAVRHIEVAHIYALQPPENARYEPAYWVGHGAVVAALRGLWT